MTTMMHMATEQMAAVISAAAEKSKPRAGDSRNHMGAEVSPGSTGGPAGMGVIPERCRDAWMTHTALQYNAADIQYGGFMYGPSSCVCRG